MHSFFSPLLAEAVTCDPKPQSHIIQLPEDCVQPETNRAEFDVGACENTLCTGKLTEQTLCDDLESESYCCQEQERETVYVGCQGYTFPIQKVKSCGCSQCERKSNQIYGRVVSSVTLENLESIVVYYKNQSVTETDSNGEFVFSTEDAVSKVSLTFRDVNQNRVLDTTVVFHVSTSSVRYGLIKMIPRYESKPLFFDSKTDNTIPVLNGGENEESLIEITIPANVIVTEDGDIYNGTVRVIINNIDTRNRTNAEVVPGDSTTVDRNGYKIPLRLFGVFSLQFTDLSGKPLFVAGQTQIRLIHPALVDECQQQMEGSYCNIMIWALNSKTGMWEKTSLLVVTSEDGSSRRKRQQDSVVLVVGNLVLREYEWYGIADIDNKDRCWSKVIAYSDENFSPTTVLPFIHQITSVMHEVRRSEQEIDSNIDIYRVSQPFSVTWNGQVGACVPMACPADLSSSTIDAFLSAKTMDKYMEPASPVKRELHYSLTSDDISRVGYHIAHVDEDVAKPQILLTSLVADVAGPIYPGSEAGEADGVCSLAGLETKTKHFQLYCSNCKDVICTTFHSAAKSPVHRQLQTFYPNAILPYEKQDYCFIGLRIVTSSSSLRVIATSNSSEGLFYGRREIVLRKANATAEHVDACMEFKCSGDVYNGAKSGDHDISKVSIDVIDKMSSSCSVQMTAQDFSLLDKQVPFTYDDPETYGLNIGTHKDNSFLMEPVCANDMQSPQTTNTERCEISGRFVHAAVINCSNQ